MSISELSVRRPVTVVMVYLLIGVISCVFVPRLGIALFPSTTRPVLSVSTTYSNVGPEEIDKNVTEYLVNRLTSVSNLKEITSVSSTGQSRINLEFGYDVDIDEAMDDVQNVINQAQRSLPDDCGTPTVRKFNTSSMPFMRLAVMGNLQSHELREIAEDTIAPLLERVDGVATTGVMGGSAKEIQVKVAVNRLGAYNITLSNITGALSGRNVRLSGGSVTQNDMNYEVVTDSYFADLDEIRDTALKTYSDGTVLRLGDVAEVGEGFDDSSRKVYINGSPGLYITVTNESDANVVTIARAIRRSLPEINAQLPEGVVIEVLSDNSTMITSTMNQVYSSAVSGIVLAALAILLFLRSVKGAFIIGLSIPISILITLMVMSAMDLTINMMSMSGLILALGMTVDSSIVILENIQLYRLRGEKPAVAAILGSRGMLNAIIASTLTTLCVFVPLLLYKADLEMFGQIFYELVITVCVAMVASLFVAVTLVPALCGSILRLDTHVQSPIRNPLLIRADAAIQRAIDFFRDGYVTALRWCMCNRFLLLALVTLLLVAFGARVTGVGMNLQPNSSSDDQVSITVTLPIGTDNDVVLERLFAFQEIIRSEIDFSDIRNIIVDSGTSNSGSIQINLPPLEQQRIGPEEVRRRLAPYLRQWPDANVVFSAGRRMGSSSGVDVEIISDNKEAGARVANDIVAILKEKVPQVTDIDTDFENGAPRYDIRINQDLAGFYGVSVSTIATTLRTAVTGSKATTFYQNSDEFDIIVSVRDEDLSTASDILSLTVPANAGLMTLDNFVSLSESKSPQSIRRENKQRINHVTANLAAGFTASEVQRIVERAINESLVLSRDVTVSYGGDARQMTKFGGRFRVIILLALFLVFAVMAAQFESLVDPFIIFCTIPLLTIGVVAVYRLTGQAFSLYTIVGVVALIGIVVNNGIVLVDYTNQLVDKKTPVVQACIEAGRSRFQPILITTLTTVLGMVPMAFFPGDGGEQMQPIGLTIVGGLTSGAALTLFVSPVLYSLFNTRREKRFDDPDSLMNQLARPVPDE